MGELSSSPPSHHHHHHHLNNNNFNSEFMAVGGCFQEQYCGDDLFATYIDLDKIPLLETSEEGGRQYNLPRQEQQQQQHRRCNSWSNHSCSSAPPDGSGKSGHELVLEAKKAMPPDKLAELWTIDPKRAKRILANRQSAARSKERKSRYIAELEQKLRVLQTEATTHSAQLSLFQRDTSGLTTENNELKLQLQAMEQQVQLHDALNEALMQEVERLKMATGEITSNQNLQDPLSFATPNLVATSYTFSPYNPTMTTTTPPSHHHQLRQCYHTETGIVTIAQQDSVSSFAADDADTLRQLQQQQQQQQQNGIGIMSSVRAAATQSDIVKSDDAPSSFSATEESSSTTS